jgi:hypothetical protein
MEPFERPRQQVLGGGVLEPLGGVSHPHLFLLEDREDGLVDRLDGIAISHHGSPPTATSWSSKVRSQTSQRHPDGSAGRSSCSPQNGQ